MIGIPRANPTFSKNSILFSDDATFCLNGTVNRQNCKVEIFQDKTGPIEAHTKYLQQLNVWASIIGHRLFELYFFERTLFRYILRFPQLLINTSSAQLLPNPQNPDVPCDKIVFHADCHIISEMSSSIWTICLLGIELSRREPVKCLSPTI